jgi:hypothetical protein
MTVPYPYQPGDVVAHIRENYRLRVGVVIDPSDERWTSTRYKWDGRRGGRVIAPNNVWALWVGWNESNSYDWPDEPKYVGPDKIVTDPRVDTDAILASYTAHVLLSGVNDG